MDTELEFSEVGIERENDEEIELIKRLTNMEEVSNT